MDDLEHLEMEENMLKLKKRQLELDFEELELRKRRANLRVGGQPSDFIASRRSNEEISVRNTVVPVAPALNQNFQEPKSSTLSSHGQESGEAIGHLNSFSRTIKNRAPGKRPAKDVTQDPNFKPNVQTDQPAQQVHLYRYSSSTTSSITETTSDRPALIDESLQISNVSVVTVDDINTSITSQATGSIGQVTEAKSKPYRKARLFKGYQYLDKYYTAWTYPEWWEKIGERLVVDSTSLLDDLLKCRAGHAESWTPLEFLQRASFVSILRQARIGGTKHALGRKIASRDLNFANENPALYAERAAWSQYPEFQRVLEQEMLVDVGGLYWRLDEMPDDYNEVMKTSGVPELARRAKEAIGEYKLEIK